MQNDPSLASIARLHAEFSCARTEHGFLHAQTPAILRDLRRALVLCSLFYGMFVIEDILARGLPGAIVPVLSRLTVPLAAIAGLWCLRRRSAPVATARIVASLFTSVAMASYMVIVWSWPREILLHGMAVALMAIVILIYIPNRLRDAVAIAGAGSLAFVLLAWHQHHEPVLRLVTMTMLILFANTFGAIAAHRHARLWREQYRTQQVLVNLSVRDPLTGCYNRRHLNAALLDDELARARRYRHGLALIMCDLDGFKAINDTHGHHAGDELLRCFAALLQSMTRDAVDTVVRYGGEEFLIILPETGLDGAVELAERVRAAFAEQCVDGADGPFGTTASFGVVAADFAAPGTPTPQGLIAAADELMYAAKRAGRNRVCARELAPA